MKFNKKVSDLARKLDCIGINSEDRRGIIEQCMAIENETTYRIFCLKKQIDKSYKEVKKAIEDFEKEYNSTTIEKEFIQLN